MKNSNPRRRWNAVISAILTFTASVWLGACNSQSRRDTEKKATGDARAQPSASTPGRMPDFHLKGTSGREVSLSQFRGKVLLVDFWATWCAPCKKEMPGYEDLYRRYRERGLVVIGIAADSDPALVAKFAKKLKITYPLLINGMDVQRYGIEGLPTTILVDRNGVIRKRVVGFEYTQVIDSDLREMLGLG